MSEPHTILLSREVKGLSAYLGGRSAYPTPVLGGRCVCCDAEGAEAVPYDPSLDRQVADPLDIPVCPACREHVKPDGKLWQLGVVSLGLGALVLVLFGGGALLDRGVLHHWPLIVSLVGVAALVGGGVFASLRRSRRRLVAMGHHPFEAMVGAGTCVIRTTNGRLADELLERNPLARRQT